MVSVPTGGRKKKLKQSIATTDVVTATHRREVAATTSTISRNVVETVAALATRNHVENSQLTAPRPPRPSPEPARSDGPRAIAGDDS